MALAALDGVRPMPDNFFASVSWATDRVIAFYAQLPDRVLLPVWKCVLLPAWDWAINEHPEAIAALASLVVAALAFRSAEATSRAQHEHNQLSVRPLVNIEIGDHETDLLVKLVNNGTGPAIIKSSMAIGADKPSEPLIDAMPKLPRADLVTWTHFAGNLTGRGIRAGGGEIVLLYLHDNGEEALKKLFALSRDKIRDALGKLTLSVDYTDIYGKSFVAKRSFGYFLRNKKRFVTERDLADYLRNLPPPSR
jgi:hypothetical protein